MIWVIVLLVLLCIFLFIFSALLFMGFTALNRSINRELKPLESMIFPTFPWIEALDRDDPFSIPGRIKAMRLKLIEGKKHGTDR